MSISMGVSFLEGCVIEVFKHSHLRSLVDHNGTEWHKKGTRPAFKCDMFWVSVD